MPKRDQILFLLDILEAIGKIERYVAGMSFEVFQSNEMAIDAVVRNLDIGGAGRAKMSGSDVDILVDFGRPVGWEIVHLHHYLEQILEMRVDLVTRAA